MSPNPFVLILGMHRSGTSCLAGCLQASGLFLGNVSQRGRFNAKGNRETKELWMLHDQILGLNKGAWHDPPDQILVHPSQLAQLRTHVNRLSVGNHVAGVKDPRTLLMLPQWLDLIGPRCRLAGTFRHPLAVAKSLTSRDQLPPEQSFNLWQRYNAELVRQHKSQPFPVVEYDLTDPIAYCQKNVRVARQLGLSPQPSKMRRFVSVKLDHHRHAESDIPECCRELYDYLKAHAVHSDDNVSPALSAPNWLRSPASRFSRLFIQSTQMPPNADFSDRGSLRADNERS